MRLYVFCFSVYAALMVGLVVIYAHRPIEDLAKLLNG